MITAQCDCGAVAELSESETNRPVPCRQCGKVLSCISSETLPDSAGAGDFDARLVITAGPERVGEHLLLGGCTPIDIGKLPTSHIALAGKQVSRAHARLVRLDAGPSRWTLEDKHSTNGLFINGQRITAQELQPGDSIRIGEYQLEYRLAEPDFALAAGAAAEASAPAGAVAQLTAAPAHTAAAGHVCPSCNLPLASKAKICVACGIHVDTGRPLLTSQGLDENAVYANSETVIRFVSWLIWVTPMPMPLASEAYGRSKPYIIWSIAALATLASILFYFAVAWGHPGRATLSLMLWPNNDGAARVAQRIVDQEIAEDDAEESIPPAKPLTPQQKKQQQQVFEKARADAIAQVERDLPRFRPYQLITHAFLHDPDSLISLIMHLGGNMLFLLVFGSRVNALIGNIATALLYPVLAVAAAFSHMASLSPDHYGPMLGASGAINGLAGMYLVLFPAHRVYCAMWFRFRWRLAYKIFTLRGFWVLLIYFAYDSAMILLGAQGSTAHWAHVGGFLTGALLGIAILLSRQFNCHNGDLLSVTLGKHAWPLIGKPSRWITPA